MASMTCKACFGDGTRWTRVNGKPTETVCECAKIETHGKILVSDGPPPVAPTTSKSNPLWEDLKDGDVFWAPLQVVFKGGFVMLFNVAGDRYSGGELTHSLYERLPAMHDLPGPRPRRFPNESPNVGQAILIWDGGHWWGNNCYSPGGLSPGQYWLPQPPAPHTTENPA